MFQFTGLSPFTIFRVRIRSYTLIDLKFLSIKILVQHRKIVKGALSSTGQVSPFGYPRVKGCLPPNRGLSQAATSFVVFLCQGIRHTLLTRSSHTSGLKRSVYFFIAFCSFFYIFNCQSPFKNKVFSEDQLFGLQNTSIL